MDGPDSLLFINCGDIFAESIFFYFLISFHRQLLCYTSTATDIPAASRASLKNRSSERKVPLEGWSSKPLFNLFVDAYWSNIEERLMQK